MNSDSLKQRVQARDRLVHSAESISAELQQEALLALRQGDLAAAEAVIARNDADLRTLAENLSIYQAELHAQAAELEEGHARNERLLTRFSTLFANMPVAAFLVDAAGVVRDTNERAAALFALQPRGAAARFLHRLVDPLQYQNMVRPAFLRASLDSVTTVPGVDFISEAGQRFVGDLHLTAMPAQAGDGAQYACAAVDRSEHAAALRAAEQARQDIKDLSERLSLALQAGGIATWYWPEAAPDVVGDERLGRLLGAAHAPGLAQALAEGEWPRLQAALSTALREHAPLDIDVQLAGSPPRVLHLTGHGHDPLHRRVRGCARDCTTEREASRALTLQQSAEAANRAKTAFLSRMSHELRTPLNAILGFSQLMRMEAEAGDLVLKPHRVELIETAARHLLALINEVMDVSTIEAGRMQVKNTRFDVRQVVAECVPLVLASAELAAVRVIDSSQAGDTRMPWWVQADRLRLKEVLINLLSNAVKYNRPQGTVEVRLLRREAPQGARVDLVVSDSGKGLSAAQQAALFEPFNRLGAEKTQVEGTGMGLFVSKRFVELMGASLSVRSEVGVGSTFTVSLVAAPD